VFSELVAIKTELLEGRPKRDLLSFRLRQLLSKPLSGARATALVTYEEISPGVRVGFERGVRAELVIAPAENDAGLGEAANNLLRMLLKSPGTWLSLEIALDGGQLIAVRHCKFALGVHVGRPADCNIFFRFQHNRDMRLGQMRLNPSKTDYTVEFDIEIPPSARNDNPVFIILFIPHGPVLDGVAALQLELRHIHLEAN
jgi:hypothetical protein